MEPIYGISIFYFISMGVGAIFLINYPEYDQFGSNEYLPQALIVAVVGFFFFLLGYYVLTLSWVNSIPRFSGVIDEKKIKLTIIVLYIVGWVGRFILLREGLYFMDVVGYAKTIPYIEYIQLLDRFCLYSLVLVSVFSFYPLYRPSFGWKILFYFIFFTELLYAAPRGGKGGLVFILLIPIIGYHYMKGFKFRIGFLILFVVLVIVSFLIFPVITNYRAIGVNQENPGEIPNFSSIYENFKLVTDNLWDDFSIIPSLGENLKSFIMRLAHINGLAVLVRDIPHVTGFYYGESYLPMIFSVIPRAIWPNRPSLDFFGNDFSRLYGLTGDFDYISFYNISILEELYINFYIFGPIFGMFLLGIAYKGCYLYLIKARGRTPVKVFVYIFFWMAFLQGLDMPFASRFISLWRDVVLFLVLIYVMKSKQIRSIAGIQSDKTLV